MGYSAKSNIANKVRNTKLPRTKPLMPLFEVISNAVHAIEEAQEIGQLQGKIRIDIIRNGNPATLADIPDNDLYPIKSFEVTDNGIGMTDSNMEYFMEADTDHKIDIGGKGVGRFVCLKAFDRMLVKSTYLQNGEKKYREFEFKASKEGFHDLKTKKAEENTKTGTNVKLSGFKEVYQKHVPIAIMDVAREIVFHFQLYFINETMPSIEIRNQNGDMVDLNNLFEREFKSEVLEKEFTVADEQFKLILIKSFKAQSHKLVFCAHNRGVREEGLYSRIVDLGKHPIVNGSNSFFYLALVVGNVLDESVDLERVGFDFPTGDDNDEESNAMFDNEITLSNVRKAAIDVIEELLKDYLSGVREAKLEEYKPIINREMPQYRTVFQHRPEAVKRLPPNLPKNKLDVELYKIETQWKVDVKIKGIKLLDENKDITSLDAYKEKYETFLEEFNDIGKSDLARYIVHRKAVIELLEQLLALNEKFKFEDEDLIHSIFFPIRSSSDEIAHDKQNLWLIDERLTYHTFLASDKKFNSIPEIEVHSEDRSDLLIFNDAIAFSEKQLPPHESFTIVEFKKPQRNDYQDYDPKKNPIEQTEKYIEALLAGKVKDRRGRSIAVDPKMPFYVYIICDITSTLVDILQRREFDKTPDGRGYFKMKTKYYNAYFEVLPFEKILHDAKSRNRILFEKLGLKV